MGKLQEWWNENKFSIYGSEEKTVLKITQKILDLFPTITKDIDAKTDLTGDHKGSWQGINRPTLSEEGLRGTVEKHITDINNINTNLSAKMDKSYAFAINDKESTKGILDIANFAGQGTQNKYVGFTFHHYTDGVCTQIDSVGQGNEILVLKNAKNPTRRPDLSEDFVGTGSFLLLKNHSNTIGNQITLFEIDKDIQFKWQNFTKGALFKHFKSDDGTSAFDFQCNEKHNTILRLLNGTSVVLDVTNDGTDKTRMNIRSGTSQTEGLKIEARSGNLDLVATSGRVRLDGHTRKVVQTCFHGATTSERPTNAVIGEMFYDTQLKKPIFYDGSIWRDSQGTQV